MRGVDAARRLAPVLALDAESPAWLGLAGAPAQRVAGIVLAGGQPVERALVRLTSDVARTGLAPIVERRTGADGRFDLGLQPAREYQLGASAPGWLAAIAPLDLRDPTAARSSATLELTLEPCLASLHGIVTDADGTPIAGAELLREDVIGATSDAAGAYDVCVRKTASASRQLQLTVRAGGFGALMFELAPAGRIRHDIVLTPEAVVEGRAVTADGTPVANARIWIERADVEARRDSEQSAPLLAATDVDGRFRFEGLAGGMHRIGGAGRAVQAALTPVTVTPGETRTIELTMTPAAVVRGRVVDDAGQPVAGARVGVLGPPIAGGDSRIPATAAASTISQADGTFILEPVPLGRVTLDARPYHVRAPAHLDVTAGDTTTVTLTVARGTRVHGVVRSRGVPATSARVCMARRGNSNVCAATDAAGRYQLDRLEPGTYDGFADDATLGAALHHFELIIPSDAAPTASAAPTTAAAASTAAITARPTADAAPIATDPVRTAANTAGTAASAARPTADAAPTTSAAASTTANNTRTAAGAAPTTAAAASTTANHTRTAAGAAPATAGAASTTANNARTTADAARAAADRARTTAKIARETADAMPAIEVDLDLRASGRIAGAVTDVDGRPVAAAHVVLAPASPVMPRSRCVADEAGRFECTMLLAGAYTPSVHAGPGQNVPLPFAGPVPRLWLEDDGARLDGVRLIVDPTRVEVRGLVVDATGAPLADARVRAWSDDRYEPVPLGSAPSTATADDGAFRLRGLTPGGYAVEVRTAPGYRTVFPVDVRAGAPDLRLVVDRTVCEAPPPAAMATRAAEPLVFDDRVRILGWDLPARVERGTSFDITLYYEVLAPLDAPWKVFIHFDGGRFRAGQADHDPDGGRCPASSWRAGQYIVDRVTARIDASDHAPPGTYDVWTGFYTGIAPIWTNLPVSAAPSALRDPRYQRIKLATITLE